MFWLLLAGVATAAAAYYRWSRRRLYRLVAALPGSVRAYPIVGHAYLFRGSSEDKIKSIQDLSRLANRQGGLTYFWLAHKLFIGLTDPKAIEVVSKTCLDKDEFTMKFMRTVTGNGAVFAPVHIWHWRRKTLMPFFKLKNLKHAERIFNEQSTILTGKLRSEVGRADFAIWRHFASFSLDSICEAAGGIKMNSQQNSQNNSILRSIDELTDMLATRLLRPWLHPDFVYKMTPVYKKFLHHKQRVYDKTDEVIQMIRKKYAIVEEKYKEDKKDGLITLLDMLIQTSGKEEKSYSDLELREEVIVMVVAGNDTSATGLGFTAVMLSRHPDVQDRVYQELKEVFGDSDRAVTWEDLPSLKYLEAVIKESLRLYPPVPIVVRELHKDLVLPTGLTLVDGASVVFSIWGTHRNPAYWGADAEQFRPERFLEGPLLHPAQFIPFSYSVRNCIGSTFAMLSIKTALANLLRRYRLLPPANMAPADLRAPLRVKYHIMMKAVDDYVLRIEERK